MKRMLIFSLLSLCPFIAVAQPTTISYKTYLEMKDPKYCQQNPKNIVRSLSLHLELRNHVPAKAPDNMKNEVAKHKELYSKLDKLDVMGFCRCRLDAIKAEITVDDVEKSANWMDKEKKIVHRCIEKNS
jgi:hypothetical protein